jgi:hypothetical protein
MEVFSFSSRRVKISISKFFGLTNSFTFAFPKKGLILFILGSSLNIWCSIFYHNTVCQSSSVGRAADL